MKILNYLIIIFICINPSVKADSKQTLINELQKGGKLIFIRHAYAPGGGDPDNFDINDCTTQRNLSDSGRVQSQKIGNFFKKDEIVLYKNLSDLSEKIIKYSNDFKLRKLVARKGRSKYFKYFNSTLISEFILNKTFGIKKKYFWENFS